MRHKLFVEPEECPDAEWYPDWKKKAAAETVKAMRAHGKGLDYEFNGKIWGKVKKYLFELFDGKCAYCEAKVTHVSFGDVEHFRPKGKVMEDDSHPGYYWLAYDLRNLLPSCALCNQGGGKMNQFPVDKNLRANGPADPLRKEKPLLLHPCFDESPEKHIVFTIPNLERRLFLGTVYGRTKRGKTTIKICNLNREPLVTIRAKRQADFYDCLLMSLARGTFKEVIDAVQDGSEEFSAALRCVLLALQADLKRLIR